MHEVKGARHKDYITQKPIPTQKIWDDGGNYLGTDAPSNDAKYSFMLPIFNVFRIDKVLHIL